MKRIILTGGGTAGHVTPNLALLPALYEKGFEVRYIGSLAGIEKGLVEKAGVPYYGIESGKLRRYFDLKNFTDPFRVQRGFFEARRILKEWRPDVIFSKGGFVAVPVVAAARGLKIPVVIHESDMTPGLANKLSFPSATKVCCNFPETAKLLPPGKAVVTGCPIRRELLSGTREAGLACTGLSGIKPVVMIIGGSLGSVHVNEAVRKVLPELLKKYDVVHLCGKGNLSEELKDTKGYLQYEFVSDELKDVFALADVVISRAGANAICELLALRKPNLLIPLSAAASRGDQILNANSFRKQGYSEVLEEEELTDEKLLTTVRRIYEDRDMYIRNMEKSSMGDAVTVISDMLEGLAGGV